MSEISNALQKVYTQNHSSFDTEAYREAFYCWNSDDEEACKFCEKVKESLKQINLISQSNDLKISKEENFNSIIMNKINEIKHDENHNTPKGFYVLLIVSSGYFSDHTEIEEIEIKDTIYECMVIYDSEKELSEATLHNPSRIRIWKTMKWDIESGVILLNHAVYYKDPLAFTIKEYNENVYKLKSTVYCINYAKTCEKVLGNISFHLNEKEYEDEEIIEKLDIISHQRNIMQYIPMQRIFPIIGYQQTVEKLDLSTDKSIIDRIAVALRCQVNFSSTCSLKDILMTMYGKEGDESVPGRFLKRILDDTSDPSVHKICEQYIKGKNLLGLEKLQNLFPILYLCKGLISWFETKRSEAEKQLNEAKSKIRDEENRSFRYFSPVTINSIVNGLESYFDAYQKVIDCSVRENYFRICIHQLQGQLEVFNKRIEQLREFKNQIISRGCHYTWKTSLDPEQNINASRDAFDENSIVSTIEHTVIDSDYSATDIEDAAIQIISQNTDTPDNEKYPAICMFYNNSFKINIDNTRRSIPKDFINIPVSYLSKRVIKALIIYTELLI